MHKVPSPTMDEKTKWNITPNIKNPYVCINLQKSSISIWHPHCSELFQLILLELDLATKFCRCSTPLGWQYAIKSDFQEVDGSIPVIFICTYNLQIIYTYT